MIETTFFAAADRKYEDFVIPYAASALRFNKEARVEICIEDPRRFYLQNQQPLEILEEYFPGRLLLRSGLFDNVVANSVRFLERPQVPTEYVYFGDIDILVLERITPMHLKHMEKTGLPYSNVLRSEGGKLSGLHFTRSEAFYPISPPDNFDLSRGNDEHLLFEIVSKRSALPEISDKFRPLHGIHLSPNRRPRGKVGEPDWSIAPYHASAFRFLIDQPFFKSLCPLFSKRVKVFLMLAHAIIDAEYAGELGDEGRKVAAQWRDQLIAAL
ncbi:hypothetical protein [Nitratireductor basaltis]|uniref:Uncharacterized protein n=1 Tax=Nitratireductor basaltis TaxID=472175 RepID=A0A084UBI8_9HYPH|nr:hypothetical protein [Nitratireductor basaltis]KFB10324.1 hypothetical protein EL18_01355 [Nitratireductor basaltis]